MRVLVRKGEMQISLIFTISQKKPKQNKKQKQKTKLTLKVRFLSFIFLFKELKIFYIQVKLYKQLLSWTEFLTFTFF